MITWIAKLRGWFARLGSQLFATPYLPKGLIMFVLALALTDMGLILLRQSAVYWSSYTLAENDLSFVRALLTTHPLALLGATLAYIVILWAITGLLTRSLALVIWLALVLAHTSRVVDHSTHLFGLGSTGSLMLLLVIGLVAGVILSTKLLRSQPTSISPERVLRKFSPRLAVLFGMIVVVLLVSSSLFWIGTSSSGWKLLKPAHSPGSRSAAAVAYDAKHKQVIFFGGGSQWLGANYEMTNDTWTWTGEDWQEIPTGERPPARLSHAMAFDEQRGTMVLFGGEGIKGRLNDTWQWDGQTWKQILPTEGIALPQPRSAHQMFYDPDRKKVILSCGYTLDDNKQAIFLNDTWEWDGKNWSPIASQIASPATAGFSAARDLSSGSLYAISYQGLLIWAGDHWNGILQNPKLVGRTDARMVSAAGTGLVLFGGTHDKMPLKDTWLFQNDLWKEYTSFQHPTARYYHTLFYDPASQRVILFGGYGDSQVLSDTWALTLQ